VNLIKPRTQQIQLFTGPPNGPVLFCTLSSVGISRLSSSVTLPADGRVGDRRSTRNY